jgi:GntR family transcriptional regulator
VIADRALARVLGCEPRSRWLRISSLRLDTQPGAPPTGWTDVYLDPSLSGVADLARTSPDVLISTLIEQHYGRKFAEIQQDITATAIPGRLAGKLAATAGSPALQIVRRYIDPAPGTFEISVTLHPAERFTFPPGCAASARNDLRPTALAKMLRPAPGREMLVSPSRPFCFSG